MLCRPNSNGHSPTDGASFAPPHPCEIDRLASLRGLHLDIVEAEPLFDEIARQAASLCRASFATVTIVREHDQAFLGNVGLPGAGSDRDHAICARTILERESLVVEDLRQDRRFADLPIVKGAPFVRFYAGVPMFDPKGLPLGSLCVLDSQPREVEFGAIFALQGLARKAMVLLESRRFVADLLGPNPHPVALHKALTRMDRVLGPLFEK